MMDRPRTVQIHPADNVAVATELLPAGEQLIVGDAALTLSQDVPPGHKIAMRRVARGEPIIKYGFPIGRATDDIEPGSWVHSHNLSTGLSGLQDYAYAPGSTPPPYTG